jgi:hypothetical protein
MTAAWVAILKSLFVRCSHPSILPVCLHNRTPEPLPVACSLRLLRVALVFRAWVQTSTEHTRTESTQQTPSQETPRKARLLGSRGWSLSGGVGGWPGRLSGCAAYAVVEVLREIAVPLKEVLP